MGGYGCMKKIIKTEYQCEGCFKYYDDEFAANHCEEEHRTIQSMEKCYGNSGEYYPDSIDVTFDDGEIICYNRD